MNRWILGVVGSVVSAIMVTTLVGIWGSVHRAETEAVALRTQMLAVEARVSELRADLKALGASWTERESIFRVELDKMERRCMEAIGRVVKERAQ